MDRGSYEEARQFTENYDETAGNALRMTSILAGTAHHYATVLITLGHNHALAEWEAGGKQGPEPVRPPVPPTPVFTCRIPLPSAGGPGNGIVSDVIELAELIGVTVPDGNTTTMTNTAEVWDRIKAAPGVTAFPGILEAAAVAFQAVTAPEASAIDEDLRALKSVAEGVITMTGDLGGALRTHRAAVDELRAQMETQLIACRDALLLELAINAAVSVASSWVTFGASAAVGVAAAIAICARYARPIRASVEAWRAARAGSGAIRTQVNVAKHQQTTQRLNQIMPEPKKPVEAPKPTVPKPNLNQKDLDMLRDYTGSGAGELNGVLRSGDELSDAHQFRIESINEALDKLPNHTGPVTRRTELPPEVLDTYQEGATITEKSFTSTSSNPTRFDGPVEFQIQSKTGKNISDYSVHPDESEVLFKSGTSFEVLRRYVDPNTGRTIIQMKEV
ncbi:ADP-ribosyltransferase [Nocardia lijiangensis]|uniref:ADP-ribosyltransferase n=1 Tax=Nocardia lijiangensis TaxID=299618 RepID=UPI003D72B2F6